MVSCRFRRAFRWLSDRFPFGVGGDGQTTTRAHTAPKPSLEHDAETLERPTRARTAPVARHTEPKRDNMGDTPMAEESEAPGTVGCAGSGGKHVECHCEHVSFLIRKYPKMGMDAILQHLNRLDNQKDGLEEDIAGILDDQSEAERDMAELRAEQDRYREKLEMALQKQQRVVDSLLHLVEDMSGRLKRLQELQPLASGLELPARPATAELVERVKTLRSAMERPMGGPAECNGIEGRTEIAVAIAGQSHSRKNFRKLNYEMNGTNRKGLHRIKELSYLSLRLTEIDSQRIIE